jgi:DNA-directed RNA polymerase specialized sigma24 family protein
MDASREPGEITRLLFELKGGNPSVEPALMALVYDELRRMARNLMRRERPNHTLQTTALVHEAYLRLVDQKRQTGRTAVISSP